MGTDYGKKQDGEKQPQAFKGRLHKQCGYLAERKKYG
jgi:hypothetical protein